MNLYVLLTGTLFFRHRMPKYNVPSICLKILLVVVECLVLGAVMNLEISLTTKLKFVTFVLVDKRYIKLHTLCLYTDPLVGFESNVDESFSSVSIDVDVVLQSTFLEFSNKRLAYLVLESNTQ